MVDEREEASDEPENLDQLLRELVRNGMDRHDYSQYKLAQVAGVSERHLSQLLNGKTRGSVAIWDRLLKAVSDGEQEEDE